jgi:hypothetical protein
MRGKNFSGQFQIRSQCSHSQIVCYKNPNGLDLTHVTRGRDSTRPICDLICQIHDLLEPACLVRARTKKFKKKLVLDPTRFGPIPT